MSQLPLAPPGAGETLVPCTHCWQILRVPSATPLRQFMCPCCEVGLNPLLERIKDNGWALVFSAASLIFYPLAMFLPMLRISQLGHSHDTNLVEGTLSLLDHGQVVVGIIVLACSILLPFSKAVSIALLASSITRKHFSPHVRAQLFHIVEFTGRWGFIDVLLVAVLIAILKLGDLVQVSVGPGLLAFALCVVFSLLSTTFFNTRTLWEKE